MKSYQNEIGPHMPHEDPTHRRYIGSDPALYGKTALVGHTQEGGFPVAQFDDISTGYGYGWHEFGISDFSLPERE